VGGHAPSAAPTHQHPHQQTWPFAWRSDLALGEVVEIRSQYPTIRVILCLGNVGWVDIWYDDLPLLNQATVVGDTRLLARLHLLHAPAIDEDPRIDRAGQDLLDHLVGWSHPNQSPSVGTSLDIAWHLELVLAEVALDGPPGLEDGKLL